MAAVAAGTEPCADSRHPTATLSGRAVRPRTAPTGGAGTGTDHLDDLLTSAHGIATEAAHLGAAQAGISEQRSGCRDVVERPPEQVPSMCATDRRSAPGSLHHDPVADLTSDIIRESL
jgi:hypothetical protein